MCEKVVSFNDTRFTKIEKPRCQKTTPELAFHWLLGLTVLSSDASGFVICWKIPREAEGIDHTPAGYCRMSFARKKVMCHRFVAEHIKGKQLSDETQVSHLCGNADCCRPSHLCLESRQENMSRIGCVGYVVHKTANGLFSPAIRVCSHNPPCKKVKVIESTPEILTSM